MSIQVQHLLYPTATFNTSYPVNDAGWATIVPTCNLYIYTWVGTMFEFFSDLCLWSTWKGSPTTEFQQNAWSYGKSEMHARLGSSGNLSNYLVTRRGSSMDRSYVLLMELPLAYQSSSLSAINHVNVHPCSELLSARFMSPNVLFHGDQKVEDFIYSVTGIFFRSTQLMAASRRKLRQSRYRTMALLLATNRRKRVYSSQGKTLPLKNMPDFESALALPRNRIQLNIRIASYICSVDVSDNQNWRTKPAIKQSSCSRLISKP